MLTLVTDPGLRGCGCALFQGTTLARAGYVRSAVRPPIRGPEAWYGMARAVRAWCAVDHVDQFIIEVPQVYRGQAHAKELIELAGVCGAVAHAVPGGQFRGYYPRQWTLGVEKHRRHEVMFPVLTDPERAAIERAPVGLMHNTYDAIGLGLYHFERTAQQ